MAWDVTSPESEELVVGGCFVNTTAFFDAQAEVQPDDFADRKLSAVWQAMCAAELEGTPIDAVAVWQRMIAMRLDGALKHHGGVDFIVGLMSRVVTVENLPYHAKQIAMLAERRRWESKLREMVIRVRDPEVDSTEFFAEIESTTLALLAQRRTTTTLLGARDAMKQLLREIEQRYDEKDMPKLRGVPTGFWIYDSTQGGLRAKQLIVLAARPRVGKSAMAGNIVEYAARKLIPCLIFSLEMGGLEVYERMLSSNGIEGDALRTGKLTLDDFKKLSTTASDLASPERIWIDDVGEITITELRSRARRWRARQGAGALALVVVDYLQLVKSGRKGDVPREQEVAEVSRGLKALAKELACPVLALAQLNREVDKRANKRPTIADLRESGQIEQDADIIAFIYREEIADEDCAEEDKGTAELIIAKGRSSKAGKIDLLFHGPTTKFTNRRK